MDGLVATNPSNCEKSLKYWSDRPGHALNGGAARRLCVGQNVEMETAHESEPIRRAGGAESPTFDIYSATGAEKLKWAPKSMGNGVSLMVSGLIFDSKHGAKASDICYSAGDIC